MSELITTNVSEHIPIILENVTRNRNDVIGQIETARQQTEVAQEQVASMNTLIAALEVIRDEGLQGKVAARVASNEAAAAEVDSSPSKPAASNEG